MLDRWVFLTPTKLWNIFYLEYRMIYTSGIVSLIIQFVVGVIDYLAINKELSPKDEILRDLVK
jgi:hypothetical protein